MHCRRMLFVTILSTVLFTSSCGDDVATPSDQSGEDSTGDDADNDDGGSTGQDNSQGTDGEGSDDSDASGDGDDATDNGPDNEDAADITGNPDLDLEDLPDDIAETLDDIDDIVSIGECSSEVVGLAVVAPEGWLCRVLDQPVGGQDGFTVFTEGNQLNITIGTPSPLGGPCDIGGLCDDIQPIDLSDNFPDTMIAQIVGLPMVYGTHASVDAELIITHAQPFSDEELSFISEVLDSAVPV